jgi:hypothetical protein
MDIAPSSLKLGVQAVGRTVTTQLSVFGAAELDTTEQIWIGILLPPFDVQFGGVFFNVPRVVDSSRSEDCRQTAVVVKESFHADRHGLDIEEEGAVNSIVDLQKLSGIWGHVLCCRIIAFSDAGGNLVQMFFDTGKDSWGLSHFVGTDVTVPGWRLGRGHVDLDVITALHDVFGRQFCSAMWDKGQRGDRRTSFCERSRGWCCSCSCWYSCRRSTVQSWWR